MTPQAQSLLARGGALLILYLAQFRLDTTVSLQTVIGVFVWVISFVIFMTTVRDDVKAIKEYVRVHQPEANQRDEQIQALGLIAERLTVLVDNLSSRVDRVEHNCDRRHNNGRAYDETR